MDVVGVVVCIYVGGVVCVVVCRCCVGCMCTSEDDVDILYDDVVVGFVVCVVVWWL